MQGVVFPVRAWLRADLKQAAVDALVRARDALMDQQDRWVLWLPVLFGAGAATYFALRFEPGWMQVLLLPLFGVFAAWRVRAWPLALLLIVSCLVFALGFAAVKLRTLTVGAPMLPEVSRAYDVKGWIEESEPRNAGETRLTIRVLSLGAETRPMPYRVRLTVRGKGPVGFGVGEAAATRAILRAPPGPVMPGGYDFARAAYFERIGGSGFTVAPMTRLDDAPSRPLSITLLMPIENLRALIGRRILGVVPGETGDIANALITGNRAGISEETTEALRNSGLYHVISISGLHMVIMAGALFWLVRALLAAIPTLAVRWPVKKIAAVVALAGALFYLLLSGGSLPTQRAWIMITIAFLAVLLDRPAISLRTVALSALGILVLTPESIVDVSFQMSFAAVVALVAFYEWRRERRGPETAPRHGRVPRALRVIGLLIFGAALTTLVAGTAVMPFSVYHFQNAQHYAVVANVLASPIITVLIMPAALVSLLLMPLGLEALALHAMALGIDWMLAIAREVASWSGAVSTVPRIPTAALVLIAIGGLWLCLWRGRVRLVGVGVMMLGLALAPLTRHPDIFVDRDGRAVAVRGSDGLLAPSPVRRSNYAVEKWLVSDGDARGPEQAVSDAGRVQHCYERACVAQLAGKRISLIRHAAALDDDCRVAEVVVAPFTLSWRCAAPIVIDARALRAKGAHALYLDDGDFRIETVAGLRGVRPWVSTAPAADRKRDSEPMQVQQPEILRTGLVSSAE